MNNNSTTQPMSTSKYRSDMSSQELDKISLSGKEKTIGLLKFILGTAIAYVVFFTNLTIGDESQVVFGWIYNFFIDILGVAGFWLLVVVIGGNLILHVFSKYIDKGKKHPKLAKYYAEDNIIHTFLYALGTIYVVCYALHETFGAAAAMPEIIVGASTGGSVVPPIVLGVVFIIFVGAFFMPFLLNYGAIEMIGALLEPLMRPLFRVPGKAALDATASFVSSSSLAVIITSRLYKGNVYTEREAVSVATCFSAVSIGFAYLVIDTAGMSHFFTPIYAISFLSAFVISAIVVRIPPISKKSNLYYNGKEQTAEELSGDSKFDSKIFGRAYTRAVKRAYTANNIFAEIKNSLVDGFRIMPQVLSMLSAIGVSALILAEYTPFFAILGSVFEPLLQVLQIPDAAAIAPSIPVGIAEMFLPVLLIQNDIGVISEAARFFVCVVSMVQIIFFSETATVMLATKLPIKFHEIIICFIERTIIALPIAALFTHILF